MCCGLGAVIDRRLQFGAVGIKRWVSASGIMTNCWRFRRALDSVATRLRGRPRLSVHGRTRESRNHSMRAGLPRYRSRQPWVSAGFSCAERAFLCATVKTAAQPHNFWSIHDQRDQPRTNSAIPRIPQRPRRIALAKRALGFACDDARRLVGHQSSQDLSDPILVRVSFA